ncbi:MAG TPA: sensor histidine kinase [Chryseosolibacter sp.]|nr:sensor histidine kinase [Chryseosolibacter sp.]
MAQSEATEIYLIIAVGIVTMMVMAGAIIIFVVFYQKRMLREQMKRQVLEAQYQQKMLQAELESQEAERRRLAADLHDSIGGMLSTIRVGISTMARMLPNPQTVDQTKQMLDDTISSVRRISRDLMPSTLEKFGLLHALTELCERFEATSKINIAFHHGEVHPSLDKPRELMIFRVVQELLNNAIKHSEAKQIDVRMNASESELKITVEDDGVGFNPDDFKADAKSGKGLGLYNIENRARLLGADLTYNTTRIKGSETIITLPLSHEQKP